MNEHSTWLICPIFSRCLSNHEWTFNMVNLSHWNLYDMWLARWQLASIDNNNGRGEVQIKAHRPLQIMHTDKWIIYTASLSDKSLICRTGSANLWLAANMATRQLVLSAGCTASSLVLSRSGSCYTCPTYTPIHFTGWLCCMPSLY